MNHIDAYRKIVRTQSPEKAGDFCAMISDAEAKELYLACSADDELKDKIVMPMTYDYTNQNYRWAL